MSLADIRTELKTVLEGVSGIGQVYDYLRWSNTEKDFKSIFKASNDKINAWQITRRGAAENIYNQNHINIQEHNMLIWGIYGAKDADASEKTFQDLIEAILAAIRTAGKGPQPLSGKALFVGPPQVEKVEHRIFSKLLVHSCDIGLKVKEYIRVP
jgi:hypothetical protein